MTKNESFEWKNAIKALALLFCVFAVSLFWGEGASAEQVSKKLPDYYVGHWTSAAIRSGDFSYVLRCDGTGEARLNHGKKEKFQDITYRVLSVSKDNEALLFVKTLDTPESIALACGNDHECVRTVKNPFYLYWLIAPSDAYGPGYKMMRLEEFDWGSGYPPFVGIENPYEKTDEWLKNFFEYNKLNSNSTSGYHYRGSLPCTHK